MDVIASRIVELVHRLISRPIGSIRPDSFLLDDLALNGDDYAMTLIPQLQREFKIQVSRERWEQVRTVEDLVDVVREHLPLSES